MVWFLGSERRRIRREGQSRPSPPRWSKRSGHSIFVRFLRLALPVSAGVLFVVVALWRDIVPNPELIGLEASALPSSAVEELTMVRPRFDGLDKDGQPYTLTAERANQADEEGDMIYLVQPAADITLLDGRWVAVSANGGRYFRHQKQLELDGDVSLYHDDGYEIRTSAAAVDFSSGVIESDAGVAGQGPRGEMQAQGVRVTEEGNVINLKGRSMVIILPGQEGSSRL